MRKYPVNLPYYREIINKMKEDPVEKGGVLLYGSSFFTNWINAKAEVGEASGGKYKIVNHGFGGATADDLLYHYSELVTPYEPQMIVFRMGPNDIFHGFSAKEAWDIAWRILEFSKADNANVKLVLLCVFEYKSAKQEHKAIFEEFNSYQKEYALENENVFYIDINDFFYEKMEYIGSYTGFRDIFLEDGLHLRPEVYKEFAEYFVKRLKELDNTLTGENV